LLVRGLCFGATLVCAEKRSLMVLQSFAIPVIAFGAVVLGVLALCFLVVRHYTDKDETEPLPFWVAILGLALPLFSLLLIPLDIYNVSMTDDAVMDRAEGIKIAYQSIYLVTLVFMFGLIPFAYFYYESEDEDVTIGKKILGGCKYTAFLLVLVIVLLSIGLILFFADKTKLDESKIESINGKAWLSHIASGDENTAFDSAIAFAVSCLTILGYIIWITYTAYGLSALPIRMIRGRKHIGEESQSVNDRLRDAREQKRLINSKYAGGRADRNSMSRRDRSKYDKVEREERILSRHSNRLGAMNKGWRKVLMACKPFMFIFGIAFVLFSLFLVVSMGITNFVKVTQKGWCQGKCGFLLAYPQFYNPLDALLTVVSPYFPADYVILLVVVAYIFFATLSGIVGLGIRFLWMTLYKLQPRHTAPQGLLLMAAYLMLAVLALNMEILTLAPQYATWGDQKYTNETSGDTVPCSMDSPIYNGTNGGCKMTEIGMFVSFISVRMPFFAGAFFYGTFAFLITYLGGIVLALFKAKGSNLVKLENDSDSDEDW
jgi:LMBR1 domain-containing protein 1